MRGGAQYPDTRMFPAGEKSRPLTALLCPDKMPYTAPSWTKLVNLMLLSTDPVATRPAAETAHAVIDPRCPGMIIT